LNRISTVRPGSISQTQALALIGDAKANDSRISRLKYFWIGGFISAAVIYLFWFSRAYKNLFTLNVSSPEGSPFGAVWSFVIPVVSFWWPYRIFREIWRASGSEGVDSENTHAAWRTGAVTPLIPIWWLPFVLCGIAPRVLLIATPSFSQLADIERLRNFDNYLIAAFALNMLSAVLAICRRHCGHSSPVGRRETSGAKASPSGGSDAGSSLSNRRAPASNIQATALAPTEMFSSLANAALFLQRPLGGAADSAPARVQRFQIPTGVVRLL